MGGKEDKNAPKVSEGPNGVMFVTLHVVGSNNNFETRGLDNPDSPLRCLTPIPGSTAPPQPASAVAEAQVLL